MAGLTKFNCFKKDLIDGKHAFGTHTFKVLLTNVAPVVTNTIKANLTEIAAGNGYSAGGPTATCTTATITTSGAKLSIADVTVTASGAVGPFRYAVLYNATTSGNPLVAFADLGAHTLANLDTHKIDFDDTNGVFTL